MKRSIELKEALTKIIKYLFGGLIVGFVAFILPNNKLQWSEIWLLALTAASAFSVLDLLSPTICKRNRQGVGLYTGFPRDAW